MRSGPPWAPCASVPATTINVRNYIWNTKFGNHSLTFGIQTLGIILCFLKLYHKFDSQIPFTPHPIVMSGDTSGGLIEGCEGPKALLVFEKNLNLHLKKFTCKPPENYKSPPFMKLSY